MDQLVLLVYIFMIITVFEFVFIIFMLVKSWTDIMAFLFPENYFEYEVLYPDDSLDIVLDKLPAKSSFEYKEGVYFVEPKKGFKSGRLTKYYYDLDNPHPKDIRTTEDDKIKISYNPKVLYHHQTSSFSALFAGSNNLENFLGNWKLWAILIVIIIGAILFKGQGG